MKNKLLLYIISIFTFTLSGYGQEGHGGKPITFDKAWSTNALNKAKGTRQLNTKQLSVIDNVSEASEVEKMSRAMGEQKSMIYGKGVDVNVDFKEVANMQLMGDSGKLYLYQINSPTAYALQVYFDAFKLPNGARMYLYDKDKTMFLGAFTHQNNYINKHFGTQFIPGNTVVIEYYEPNNVEFESQIHISKISHVFNDLKSGDFTPFGSGSCNINASCMLGYGWGRERKSVAIVLLEIDPVKFATHYNFTPKSSYFGLGTGALINDVQQDGEPYFLTANHLFESTPNWSISSGMNTNDWIFLFNHESSCTNDGANAPSLVTFYTSIFGACVLSQDQTGSPYSDYLLLQLAVSKETLKNWKVIYAGWDRDEVRGGYNTQNTVCIHHPSGDARKISQDLHPPKDATLLNPLYCWEVDWENGVTEQGSSGAPLFNSNHKIIGQLRSGSSSCSNPTGTDRFGKFSISYELGNFWLYLDPLQTQSTSVGSYNPSESGEHCYNGIWDAGEDGVDCGGADCPPCSWVPTTWGCPTCNNKVMDTSPSFVRGVMAENPGGIAETGIDCGGICRPCGGTVQCSNGIQDGDETDVDCGGSCTPCSTYCLGSVDYIYGANLPAYTSTSNYISASNVSVDNKKVVTFKSAGKIFLKTGFSAKVGSTFKAECAPCDKCKKISVQSLPNAICNSSPWGKYIISVTGADRYDLQVYNHWNNKVFTGNGQIYNTHDALSDAGGITGKHDVFLFFNNTLSDGSYSVLLNLYNDCSGEVKKIPYYISVISRSNVMSLTQKKETNDIIDNEISSNGTSVYPNPSKGLVTLKSSNNETIETINIFSSNGQQIIHKGNEMKLSLIEVNLSNYPDGTYIVKVQTTKSSYTSSVILRK